jgi:hypothetical protein
LVGLKRIRYDILTDISVLDGSLYRIDRCAKKLDQLPVFLGKLDLDKKGYSEYLPLIPLLQSGSLAAVSNYGSSISGKAR